MQRLKVMILAMMAVFALGAVVATTASAGVEALNANGEPTSATFTGHTTSTTTLGVLKSSNLVSCGLTQTEGSIEPGGKLGLVHIHFDKCTTNSGGTCTGLGDEAGSILALGPIHLATNSSLTIGYVLFLIEHVHFSCTVLFITKLVLVLGELLCGVTPINVVTKKLKIKCERGAEDGDPAVTSYENDKGEAATLTNALKSVEGDTGTEEMASELGESEVELTPEVKLDV